MRRFLVLLVVPLALLVAACDIFQIALTLDRVGEVQGTEVTLRGTVTCTDPAPLLLAATIQQGTLTQFDETQIYCEDDNPWVHTFVFAQPFQTGGARVTVTAQTRPDRQHDSVQVSRDVVLVPPGS